MRKTTIMMLSILLIGMLVAGCTKTETTTPDAGGDETPVETEAPVPDYLTGIAYVSGEGGHIAVIDLAEFTKDPATYIPKRIKPKGLGGGSELQGIVAGMDLGEATGKGAVTGGTHGAGLLADKETLVVGTLGGQVYELNVNTKETTGPFDLGVKFCDAMVGPDGLVYLEDMADGNIYIYDPETNTGADVIPMGDENENILGLCGIDWLDDGTMIITDMPTGTVHKINAEGEILGSVTVGTFLHQGTLTPDQTEFWVTSPDEFNVPETGLGGWSIAGEDVPSVTIINPATMEVIEELQTPDLFAHDVEFTPDGKYALISSRDYKAGGWLSIMDTESHEVICQGEVCKSCHEDAGEEFEDASLCGTEIDWTGFVPAELTAGELVEAGGGELVVVGCG